MIDRNRVNEATKDKLREVFMKVDANQDGQITPEEMTEYITKHI